MREPAIRLYLAALSSVSDVYEILAIVVKLQLELGTGFCNR